VTELAHDVLRHRIVPSFAALAEEVSADMILDRLLPIVPVPQLSAGQVEQVAGERSA
jgi:MoxR-like ATPase